MRWLVTGLMLLAAGCGGGGGEADYNAAAAVPREEARAQAAIEAEAARNGVETAATIGVPVATPTPTAARLRAFPTDFLGYWGAGRGDCDLANPDAAGRINIDADMIRLHEARARVEALERRSPYQVVATLRFDARGRIWQRPAVFRLENGGTVLIRDEAAGGGRPALAIRYKRC